MKIKQWRDLSFNPFDIKFKNFKLLNITSYPYAQNDVIEIKIVEKNKTKLAFLKYERSKKANLEEEQHILKILQKNNLYSNIPKIIEVGLHNKKYYTVLEKITGEKLSTLLKKATENKDHLLMLYGEELANIHKININDIHVAMKRSINYIPKDKDYNLKDNKIIKYITYLNKYDFKKCNKTFIHGDFHYGNVLFKDKIEGVLDWEYAGLGLKEQDIAWALILRPGQLFLDNVKDIQLFLKGYGKYNSYNYDKLKWCLINGYCHFYLMNKDLEYKSNLLTLLELTYNDGLK